MELILLMVYSSPIFGWNLSYIPKITFSRFARLHAEVLMMNHKTKSRQKYPSNTELQNPTFMPNKMPRISDDRDPRVAHRISTPEEKKSYV